jgi:glucose-1-phosphate thymidylyltransferase
LEEIDAAGKWIAYLVKNRDVYSLEIAGRLDIGGLESYLEAEDYFSTR